MDTDKNEIVLTYGGVETKHNVTKEDVAGYVAYRLAPIQHSVEFKTQIRDALTLIEAVYDLRGRFGYAQLFGKDPNFQSYLLRRTKDADPK